MEFYVVEKGYVSILDMLLFYVNLKEIWFNIIIEIKSEVFWIMYKLNWYFFYDFMVCGYWIRDINYYNMKCI